MPYDTIFSVFVEGSYARKWYKIEIPSEANCVISHICRQNVTLCEVFVHVSLDAWHLPSKLNCVNVYRDKSTNDLLMIVSKTIYSHQNTMLLIY